MNKQEKRIIIGGIAITALASAGFAMGQGNLASADDNYSAPKTIVEEKKISQQKIQLLMKIM
ncbi:hypothetical protein [Faecalimicrobium dakarense]|uniref:hypothetical protein n=1 Tax=Faecalimicrobium dakarense TaxID=1301100 RepID=UPI0004B847A8|nr:hypothetical protein [[Clostridium] dakarense]